MQTIIQHFQFSFHNWNFRYILLETEFPLCYDAFIRIEWAWVENVRKKKLMDAQLTSNQKANAMIKTLPVPT